MKILNLGCGDKACALPEVVNIDWSMRLRLRRSRVLRSMAPFLMSSERLERLRSMPANILAHDLAKGIPFPDGSVDVVYHSHVLEHLDREDARTFLTETRRVLRAGGIQRIVVPDLEGLARAYLAHLEVSVGSPEEVLVHDRFIEAILEQSVRKESYGASQQPRVRRFLENLVLGDARQRGETHQWMYDRVNLRALLEGVGFRNYTIRDWQSSSIPSWSGYGFDTGVHGGEYRPGSLYVETST